MQIALIFFHLLQFSSTWALIVNYLNNCSGFIEYPNGRSGDLQWIWNCSDPIGTNGFVEWELVNCIAFGNANLTVMTFNYFADDFDPEHKYDLQ